MVERETLDNGLTLLFQRVPGVRSASIGVWLRMGSRHESARLSGICHFIEHLVFKGTRNRTAREISLLTDRIGGNLDAFTTKEMTCFYARVLDEHVPIAVDLLADIVLNPLFDAEELERERNVILEEIRMVYDSPEDRVYDLFCESFWPRHPLGRPIQGTEDSVAAMSRATVLRWFRRAYVPENLVVSVAGRITARHRELIRSTFGRLPGGPAVGSARPPRFEAGLAVERRPQLEQAHLLLGVPAPEAGADERYVLHVLNTILGGSISSRLFQTVRERNGLAYSIGSQVHAHSGAGLLMVYAGTSPGNVRRVLQLSMEELRRLAEEEPAPEDLEVARDHLKGNVLLALESTTSRMSRAAREEMILGKHVSQEEIIGMLDAVDGVAVRELAERLFSGRAMALAAVGKLNNVRLRERELTL
jgi:predicted Zn-dependent peptidase